MNRSPHTATSPSPDLRGAGDARVALLVSARPALARQWMDALMKSGAGCQLPIAASLAQARQRLWRVTPQVILLEESAVCAEESAAGGGADRALAAAVGELAVAAPVILVCAPQRLAGLEELAALIGEGRLEVVFRASPAADAPSSGEGAPGPDVMLAAGLAERHFAAARRLADSQGGAPEAPARQRSAASAEPLAAPGQEETAGADFGEILRHEVNNPLTGILGNAEMLLARRERLPAGAVERLQVIAELAVRLRETVRRLSNAYEERHARSA